MIPHVSSMHYFGNIAVSPGDDRRYTHTSARTHIYMPALDCRTRRSRTLKTPLPSPPPASHTMAGYVSLTTVMSFVNHFPSESERHAARRHQAPRLGTHKHWSVGLNNTHLCFFHLQVRQFVVFATLQRRRKRGTTPVQHSSEARKEREILWERKAEKWTD